MSPPDFTVVIATYGRGAAIQPTLRSVQRQTLTGAEVLVVSDGPAAPGLAEAVAAMDGRFRLIVTRRRVGSQSGPNNEGLAQARGRRVAYLGHDDVWHPDHLSRLARAFELQPGADFAVAGCIVAGPIGSDEAWVTGIFSDDDREAPARYFFPPSSVAHNHPLPPGVRGWPDPISTRKAIDSAFMIAAQQGGARFVSTGSISVVKFSAAMRYLAYLAPAAADQEEMLALMDDGDAFHEFVSAAVAQARASGRYNSSTHRLNSGKKPGEWHAHLRRIRGVDLPTTTALPAGDTIVEPTDDPRAMDWYPVERGNWLGRNAWRWSGPNPRPRLLLARTSTGPVRVEVDVLAFAHPRICDSLVVAVEGERVAHAVERLDDGSARISFTTRLRHDRATMVEFATAATVADAHGQPPQSATARPTEPATSRYNSPARYDVPATDTAIEQESRLADGMPAGLPQPAPVTCTTSGGRGTATSASAPRRDRPLLVRGWESLPSGTRDSAERLMLRSSPRVRAWAWRALERQAVDLRTRPRRVGFAVGRIRLRPVADPDV